MSLKNEDGSPIIGRVRALRPLVVVALGAALVCSTAAAKTPAPAKAAGSGAEPNAGGGVTVDTHGSPLLVGKPSLQNGVAYVQVDFHPAKGTKYFAVQPGASVTLTHVDPAKTGVWHGSLTVKQQRFEGHVFSYSGTFAARWCGKD